MTHIIHYKYKTSASLKKPFVSEYLTQNELILYVSCISMLFIITLVFPTHFKIGKISQYPKHSLPSKRSNTRLVLKDFAQGHFRYHLRPYWGCVYFANWPHVSVWTRHYTAVTSTSFVPQSKLLGVIHTFHSYGHRRSQAGKSKTLNHVQTTFSSLHHVSPMINHEKHLLAQLLPVQRRPGSYPKSQIQWSRNCKLISHFLLPHFEDKLDKTRALRNSSERGGRSCESWCQETKVQRWASSFKLLSRVPLKRLRILPASAEISQLNPDK